MVYHLLVMESVDPDHSDFNATKWRIREHTDPEQKRNF